MRLITARTVPEHWGRQFATTNDKPTLTQQSDANETDINLIVERYTKTGQLPQMLMNASFGDFTQVGTFQEAVHLVQTVKEEFDQIPAEIRARFLNDPQKFIEFAHNPNNRKQLQEWKITPPDPEKQTTLRDVHSALQELKPKEPPNGESKK